MCADLASGTTQRMLIVNADDFGLSDGVNEGIVRAFTHGIVRSTSLMVHMPAAEAAAELAALHPGLGVGLHLDIGEWKLENGEWVALYERVPMHDATQLHEELQSQLALFERLMGRRPTHVDSHQHVHMREPLKSIAEDIVRRHGLPLRHLSGHSKYVGDFYGQDSDGTSLHGRISTAFLQQLILALPAGASELCVHPASHVDFAGMYKSERLQELEVLCDFSIGEAISASGIELRGHHQRDGLT